jgi:long-subunit fatty acid transport protein
VTGQEIRCTRDTLADNTSSSITIRATVTAAADETISATASVTADNSPLGDPASSSNDTTAQSSGGDGTTVYLPLMAR